MSEFSFPKEHSVRKRVQKRLLKKASYGQFKTENCTQVGWFIWVMDAVDVVVDLLKEEGKTK